MKTKLVQSMAAKIIAFVLFLASVSLSLGGFVGLLFLENYGYFTRPEQTLERAFSDVGAQEAYDIVNLYEMGKIKRYVPQGNIIGFELLNEKRSRLAESPTSRETDYYFEYEVPGSASYLNYEISEEVLTGAPEQYSVKFYLHPNFPVNDNYRAIYHLVTQLGSVGYGLFAIGLVTAAVALVLFIFLLRAVGHRRGQETIVASSFTRKFPLDLQSVLVALAVSFLLFFAVENTYHTFHLYYFFGTVLCGLLALALATLYCMDVALRVKLGKWWQNTLLHRLGRSFSRGGKGVGGAVKTILHALGGLLRKLPLIYRTAILCVGFAFLTLFVLVIDWAGLYTLYFLAVIAGLLGVLYVALMLRGLEEGSRMLAAGDLSYQVDTTKMRGDFKTAGDNLNQISVGMARALEERMKSERFKTELITNVSHDIKTPLTSIINYADLITKEEGLSETVKDYSAVLLRQSERLKKLLEDLVDASKASTGNLEVNLAPCELGVLLTQTAGEYEQKLQERALLLLLKAPETPLRVMADGRLLWRVFDNLMVNIYKYAQSGTRVYLTLELEGKRAIVTFKNISSYPLDLSAEELLERFSRGDLSRNTDGNGLGLSIARSLIELQGGTLTLTVDGDLFKVSLNFQSLL